jgi:hypothetical protein
MTDSNASTQSEREIADVEWTWVAICMVLVIPLTAIFHHAIFYRPTCMLNPIKGADYSLEVVAHWLLRDPSIYAAAFVAAVTYEVGLYRRALRIFVAPFIVSFAPLSIWIWDIPFTGRAVCSNFHDQQIFLAEGVPLLSRHFYLLGFVIFGILLGLVLYRRRPNP